MSKFPENIYGTPRNWGNEIQYADHETMEGIVRSLSELGYDWVNVSISDCQEHTLINILPNGMAAYSGGWITDGYNRNSRREIVVFNSDEQNEGYFIHADSFDPKRDSAGIKALGVKL